MRSEFCEISPSEFFYKNRDLAGFSSPQRALYSALRELVENSLDACEQYSILPEIFIRISRLDLESTVGNYTIKVVDNGPGIPEEHVPNALGKVFFGSKFRLRQSRGTFGMGATMAVLYGQITTNRPVRVLSSTDGVTRHGFLIKIDVERNEPLILDRWSEDARGLRGTSVEISLLGDYPKASLKIVEYVRQTALVTPHANILFIDPEGDIIFYRRVRSEAPRPPRDTLPHPYGVDVEILRRLLRESRGMTLGKFLVKNFHRVGERLAMRFLEYVGMDPRTAVGSVVEEDIVRLADSLREFDAFLPPDASCLSPLGEEVLRAGLVRELAPEFYKYVRRPPSAYSGYPFVVELAVAYGGRIPGPGLKLFRFANKIPLLYDEANDVSWKVLSEVDWSRYSVPENAPLAIVVHICSTKVPYKTVGKEYIADRPEVEREVKNALREALRSLSHYLSHKAREERAKRRRNLYAKYLPLIAQFSKELAEREKLPSYRSLLKGPETPQPEPQADEPA